MIEDTSRRESGRDADARHTRTINVDAWRAVAAADTPDRLFNRWLDLQCRLIDGVTDGVLVLGSLEEGGRFVPAATWPAGRQPPQELASAAERALAERRHLVLEGSSSDGADGSGNQRYQLAHPIKVANRLCGVIAIGFEDHEKEGSARAMGELSQSCAWLEGLLARNGGGNGSLAAGNGSPGAPVGGGSGAVRLKEILDLVATFLQQDRFRAAATAFVTELATRLSCERVSLGFVRRRRIVLSALSHSAEFGKKANFIRALEAAMDEALDQEVTILYPESGEARGEDFRLTRAHSEYARQYGAVWICSVPLSMEDKIIGVLTLEGPDDESNQKERRKETAALCETLGTMVGPIFELKRRDDRWLVTKAIDAGRTCLHRVFGPRHLGWKIAASLIVGLILFFAFARTDYRVTAKTVLEGEIQRAAVAPFDGFIRSAPLRAGDIVSKGDTLCVLDDRDLRLEKLKWSSQYDQFLKQYHQAMAQREAPRVKIVAAQMEQAKAQLAQVSEQLSRMRVTAPFDGLIVTGDLSQSIGAPVRRGDVLFEIAPLDRFRVIQKVDERDIREVKVGQSGELVLAAFPTAKFSFTVTKVTPVSTAEEGQNYFRVEAQLAEAPTRLRPGMEGISKIEIDRRYLFWIWTHRGFDWLRLKFWSWMP